MISIRTTLAVLLLLAACTLAAQTKRPMEIEDLFRSKRLSDPQLSPDGKSVAYVVAEVLKAENRTNTDIWIIPVAGGTPRQLTSSPRHDRHPRWSPDGKWIAFESNRGGSFQIYVAPAAGGDARQVTSISTEASGAVWSADGSMLAFASAVFPEFSDKPYAESDALNKKKQDDRDNSKVKARIFTELLYRHWDSWVDGKRQHLFVVPSAGGVPRDVTPGDRDAVPTSSTFSTGDDYDFAPNGKELAYTATPFPTREGAWSTNHDLYAVNLDNGERTQLTTNLAADITPRYSPDGRYIAYRAQERPGFEADRWQLMVMDRKTGDIRSLTANFDAGVDAFKWSQDGKRLYFDAEEKGTKPLWSVSFKGNDVKKLVEGGVNGDVHVAGGTMVFSRAYTTRAAEVYTAKADGKNPKQLTTTNDELFGQLLFNQPESVTVPGAGGTPVQMWIIKPPMFDTTKKYPLVFISHGGPQGEWMDSWSTRWNPQLWAAQGYVIALPNPRGSTGFGQKFTDEISHDWGGKVFEDMMQCLAYLERQPYVDTSRMAAAGASYGGYMMNWFQGHTTKFKALVTHDGTYNFSSMYGTTEEVWFDEWEHGKPWETPDYEKFSPHKFAQNFKTPNLIIHGELDYRVPVSEGFQLFTALQRQGVPSKFLYFPDEGHWVLKPQNSELWHNTVFGWLKEYLKP
jgi:dipeptidyl aminopeptidase/acylaminoacyl peptidase